MSVYRLINPSIVRLLKSSWHQSLSKRLMVVSYSGKKSGKAYDIPVSYYRDGDLVYCFTNGNWWQNFSGQHEATLRLRGKDYPAKGLAKQSTDKKSREQQIDIMTEYFKSVPQDKKFYGVKCDESGEPVRSTVAQAASIVVMICFNLKK